MVAQSEINELVDAVRAQGVSAGLPALGRFAFGADCAIVTNGVGFRGANEKVNLVTGAGEPLADHYRVVQDHSLRSLGLEALIADSPRRDLTHRAKVGLLLYRSGLLLRILDKSYDHLNGRISGGQRTLRHQLVKSTFVECFSLAETIRAEARFLLETGVKVELMTMHETLSRATIRAAKLMGGHGFLAAQVNAVEFLSLCCFNQAAQAIPLAITKDQAA